MTTCPVIFISAVSKELRSARDLVAKTLLSLGYEPKWQDIAPTETGDLCSVLREWVDGSAGVIQLVGHCYGAEPREPDVEFGRVSYTQFEALHARRRGKKVWYLFIDEGFTPEPHEPEELRELQRCSICTFPCAAPGASIMTTPSTSTATTTKSPPLCARPSPSFVIPSAASGSSNIHQRMFGPPF
jgi:hypothetical protein